MLFYLDLSELYTYFEITFGYPTDNIFPFIPKACE